MKQPVPIPRRQLALLLQRESVQPLPEETREAVIEALADLLLEALGREVGEHDGGDLDELEDHR
jgi:hypothetical protein